MTRLEDTLSRIGAFDMSTEAEAQAEALAHLDSLTKPPGSLGVLENIAARYCGITGLSRPRFGPKRIYVFAADHGIAEHGVSAYPKAVTAQMVLNMLSGGAAVNVLGRHCHCDVRVVDIGVDFDFEPHRELIDRKIRRGTRSLLEGPAMTEEEAISAVEVGIEMADEAAREGISLLGTGDMGIANTTASAAILATLLPCPVENVTGRGTGIDDERLEHKIEVVKEAISVNESSLGSPLSTLAALGGLEIAGIAGLCLGAAAHRIPVVIDGFISTAAALVAMRMNPSAAHAMIFAHRSAEAGHRVFFEKMGVRPVLDLDMRLGEGTGAALAMGVIEAAVKVYNEMATFESAGVTNKAPAD